MFLCWFFLRARNYNMNISVNLKFNFSIYSDWLRLIIYKYFLTINNITVYTFWKKEREMKREGENQE